MAPSKTVVLLSLIAPAMANVNAVRALLPRQTAVDIENFDLQNLNLEDLQQLLPQVPPEYQACASNAYSLALSAPTPPPELLSVIVNHAETATDPAEAACGWFTAVPSDLADDLVSYESQIVSWASANSDNLASLTSACIPTDINVEEVVEEYTNEILAMCTQLPESVKALLPNANSTDSDNNDNTNEENNNTNNNNNNNNNDDQPAAGASIRANAAVLFTSAILATGFFGVAAFL